MKNLISRVLLTASLFLADRGQGQAIYEDVQMRTWFHRAGDWNLHTNQFKDVYMNSAPPFAADRIARVNVLILSDQATPEVFNISRQSGMRSFHPKRRSGGYAEIFRNPNGTTFPFMYILDRGPCGRGGSGCFIGGTNGTGTDNFFLANYQFNRSFTNTAPNRSVVKVDYICSGACGAETVHTMWKKLGSWKMHELDARSVSLTNDGISNANIVDIATAIHSDPNNAGKIQVDEFEHLGTKGSGNDGYPHKRGRGGISWVGLGVNGQVYEPRTLRLHRGAKEREPGWPTGSYQEGAFSVYDPNSGGFVEKPLNYSNGSVNRGWSKIQYTGTKSATPIPYAMKSKAIAIGSWDMSSPQQKYKKIPFSGVNVAANRITGISTTIMSDLGQGFDANGRTISNFHRPQGNSGSFLGGDGGYGGGFTYIEEETNNIVLSQLLLQSGSGDPNYFSKYGHTGSGNRGFVRLDYLAGSCETGPSSLYSISAVPGTFVGNCTGSQTTFPIEGAGRGIVHGATADSMTFVYRKMSGTLRTITARVVSQDANTSNWGFAGVMIRATLDANSRHAAMLVTKNSTNGASFRWRSTTGGGNQRYAVTSGSPHSPEWIRLIKSGDQFQAYRNPSTSTTVPTSGWLHVLTVDMNIWPSEFFVGLTVSNDTDARLSKATFAGLSVQ